MVIPSAALFWRAARTLGFSVLGSRSPTGSLSSVWGMDVDLRVWINWEFLAYLKLHGNSLGVPWLGLCVLTAMGPGSVSPC